MERIESHSRELYYLLYDPPVEVGSGNWTVGLVAMKLPFHVPTYIAFRDPRVFEKFRQTRNVGGTIINATQLGGQDFPFLGNESTIFLIVFDDEAITDLSRGDFDKLVGKIVEYEI